MLGRRPIRRFIKWAGLLLTGLLTIIWVGSLWFYASYRFEHTRWIVVAGRFQIESDLTLFGGPGEWHRWQFDYLKMNSLPRTMYWRFDYSPADGFGSIPRIWIPLWSFVLLAGVPTGVLFTRDALARRRLSMQGKCPSCKFDLTGLPANALCPECGKKSP